MIRPEIIELLKLGSFPISSEAKLEVMNKQEELLQKISQPVTDDESRELIKLFGPDDYFGVAWTILHLIETAPNWPLMDCLADNSNEWIIYLKKRLGTEKVTEKVSGTDS
jgi:hypothetical protein